MALIGRTMVVMLLSLVVVTISRPAAIATTVLVIPVVGVLWLVMTVPELAVPMKALDACVDDGLNKYLAQHLQPIPPC